MKNLRLTILVKRFPKLSETFIEGEINSLIEKGFDVRIVSLHRPTGELTHAKSKLLAGRITYLDHYNALKCGVSLCLRLLSNREVLFARFSEIFSSFENFQHLARLVEDCQIHRTVHIHAHYISDPSLIADLAAQLTGAEFSISAHAKDIYLTKLETLRKRISKAKFVVTCTAHNLTHLQAVTERKKNNVFLAYHGIDTQFFKPIDTKRQDNRRLILSVGRFKTKKGFDVLIDACALLKKSGQKFQCQIIGYGDQYALLNNKINELGLEQDVTLIDPMPHNELVPILQGASLFVLPCRLTADGDRDGIPNAMLEAMACGVPIVSTKISGIPEVIHSGENGLLVEPDDAVALASAMMRILDDEHLQQNLAARGRSTVTDRFSWTSNIQTLAELLLPQSEIVKAI